MTRNGRGRRTRSPGLAVLAVVALLLAGSARGLAQERKPAGKVPGEGVPGERVQGEEVPGEDGRAGGLFELLPESYPEADRKQIVLREGSVVAYFSGNVVWDYELKGGRVRLRADRLVLHASRESRESGPDRRARAGQAGGREEAERTKDAKGQDANDTKQTQAAKRTKNAKRDEAPAGLGVDLRQWEHVWIYAEGARLEVPSRKLYLECRSLFYDRQKEQGIAHDARLKTTVGQAQGIEGVLKSKGLRLGLEAGDLLRPDDEEGLERAHLSIRARVLRIMDLESFAGEDLEASSCDFAIPHYSLSASSATIQPVETREEREARLRRVGRTAPGPGGLEGDDEGGYIIDPEDTWLKLSGHQVIPVPVARWDTRWNTHMPVRHVDVGSSSQFGVFGAVEWNINYFLNLLPLERFVPIGITGSKARLGFETDFFEKRGTGFGPLAAYGEKPRKWEPWQLQLRAWEYYGEAQYYRIHDRGEEDRSTRLPIPEEDRDWGHIWHRQSVPHVGLFDLEYSKLSDRAFLGEYFEDIAKTEKDQETLAYFRRNFLDNIAVTGLYQTRVNDFQTQVERLPEGKAFLLQQPVFQTGLYTDLRLQSAYLHRLVDDDLGIAPRGYARHDLLNEWTYPLSWLAPYLQLRPFGLMRLTDYGEVLDEAEGSEDRATFGAGVTVSQQWSRVYPFAKDSFASEFLGIESLKHVAVPKMTYLNVLSNDLPPEDLVAVDSTDLTDLQESFALSLRNEIFTRSPRRGAQAQKVKPLVLDRPVELESVPLETRRLLDSEVSFVLFPQAARDNDGDRSSLLILDNTATLIPRLNLRAWLELDPNRDFRGERTDLSATYEVVPSAFSVTVGDRYTRDRSNVSYVFFDWNINKRWIVDAYYAHDFETRRDVEYSLELTRVLHCMALTLVYSLDVGEDRNHSFHVNFAPAELLRPARRRGYRR